MNPIQATVPDDQNVVEFSESPGRRLRVHRQSKGLEIARVAAQLHLRPSMVEALEHDQYENLPNPVFVAGYLRNYARVLGLDPEPIVASYRAANPSLEPPPPRVTGPGGPEIGSGHILVRLISLALIAGVIAMLALWWQNRADLLSMSGAKEDAAPGLAFSPGDEDQGGPSEGPGTGASEQSPAVHAGSAGSTTAGVIGEGPEELLEPRAISLTETPAARGPFHAGTSPQAQDTVPRPAPAIQVPLADVATPSHTAGVVDLASAPTRPVFSAPPVAIAPAASDAAPEPAEPAPLTEPPDSGEVALDFSGPCWIDVRDSSGSVVLTGEMAKGDRRVLAGEPPYSFVIGNASATKLTVGGKPFDLPRRSRGNVARFKLNPETLE